MHEKALFLHYLAIMVLVKRQQSMYAIQELGQLVDWWSSCLKLFLKLLTGLYPPTFGDAFIGPYSIATDIYQVRQIIGVCPQKEIIWPFLTAREHLALVCDVKGISGLEKKKEIEAKLNQVRLAVAGDRYARTFSGGMKRRLALAMAMIGDPKILFLDEPNAGVDPGYVYLVAEMQVKAN